MSEEPASTDIQQQQAPEASRRPRWGIVTLIGVILAVIGVALVYLFYQPMYEASAWIRIDERRPYIAFESKDDSRRFIETQIGLIRSPAVLAPIVSQPEIARVPELQKRGEPLQLLQQQIKVTQPKGSELLMISFRSSDREAAARVCNAVLDAYFSFQDAEQRTRYVTLINLLEKETERHAPRLRRLRETERELAMQATGRDPFGRTPAPGSPSQSATMHPLAVLEGQVITAEVDREIMEAQIKAFEEITLGLGRKATTSGEGSERVILNGSNNNFIINATERGQALGEVDVVFVADKAVGDQAIATFDDVGHTLTIDMDPVATTANTLITEINREGHFTAALDATVDSTSGGGSAMVKLNGTNHNFVVNPTEPGPAFDNVDLVFVADKAAGDQAFVTFDDVGHTLTIDIDPAATTPNTVVTEIKKQGSFAATFTFNDGTGLLCKVELPDRMVEEKIESKPLVRQVKQLIDAKRLDLFEAQITSNAEDNKQLVNRLREEIEKAESKVAQLREDLRKDVKAELLTSLAGRQQEELAEMRLQLKSLRTREESLQARYKSQLENVKQYSGETYDLVSVRDEHKRAKDVLDRIEDRIALLRTEQPAPSGVKVGHRAQVPRFPVRNPLVRIILAALGGLCLPFIVLGLWIGFARLRAWKKTP